MTAQSSEQPEVLTNAEALDRWAHAVSEETGLTIAVRECSTVRWRFGVKVGDGDVFRPFEFTEAMAYLHGVRDAYRALGAGEDTRP